MTKTYEKRILVLAHKKKVAGARRCNFVRDSNNLEFDIKEGFEELSLRVMHINHNLVAPCWGTRSYDLNGYRELFIGSTIDNITRISDHIYLCKKYNIDIDRTNVIPLFNEISKRYHHNKSKLQDLNSYPEDSLFTVTNARDIMTLDSIKKQEDDRNSTQKR